MVNGKKISDLTLHGCGAWNNGRILKEWRRGAICRWRLLFSRFPCMMEVANCFFTLYFAHSMILSAFPLFCLLHYTMREAFLFLRLFSFFSVCLLLLRGSFCFWVLRFGRATVSIMSYHFVCKNVGGFGSGGLSAVFCSRGACSFVPFWPRNEAFLITAWEFCVCV